MVRLNDVAVQSTSKAFQLHGILGRLTLKNSGGLLTLCTSKLEGSTFWSIRTISVLPNATTNESLHSNLFYFQCYKFVGLSTESTPASKTPKIHLWKTWINTE